MEEIRNIIFEGRFYDETGQPLDAAGMKVQFKITTENEWVDLVSADVDQAGVFSVKYKIPPRLPKSEKALRAFRSIIEAGGTPDLRLVAIDKAAKDTYFVVSQTGETKTEGTTLYYMFQEAYLARRERWKAMAVEERPSGKVVNVSLTGKISDVAVERATFDALRNQLTVATDELTKYKAGITAAPVPSVPEVEKTASVQKPVETVTLEKTIESNIAEIDKLNQTIVEKNRALADAQGEQQVMQTMIDKLTGELDDIKSVATFQSKSVAANTMFKNVVNEVSLAQSSTEAGFTLSNVKLDLKVVAEQDDDGIRFQLLDEEKAATVSTATISNISMEVINEAAVIGAPSRSGKLPSFIGLTETACRKKLLALGLRMIPVYQHAPGKTIGQAFKQTPEVGADYQAGQEITLIFSKDINDI